MSPRGTTSRPVRHFPDRPRRRRRDRRRRLHRPVDRLLPGGADPALRVAVLEQEVAGFGASGRNGGWCFGAVPRLAVQDRPAPRVVARRADAARPRDAGKRRRDRAGRRRPRASTATSTGGTVSFARTPSPARPRPGGGRGRPRLGLHRGRRTAARRRRGPSGGTATGRLGATFTPHCARDPSGQARPRARSGGRALGCPIYERTPAVEIDAGPRPHRTGTVRAERRRPRDRGLHRRRSRA